MERRRHHSPLFAPPRSSGQASSDTHRSPGAQNARRSNEHRFDAAARRTVEPYGIDDNGFTHGALHLPAVAVAFDIDVEKPEAAAGWMGDVPGEKDGAGTGAVERASRMPEDRKSTRLN